MDHMRLDMSQTEPELYGNFNEFFGTYVILSTSNLLLIIADPFGIMCEQKPVADNNYHNMNTYFNSHEISRFNKKIDSEYFNN